MAKRFAPEIDAAIDRHARANGLDPATLRAFVAIESGGNPNLVNRYGYSGLLQLRPSEAGSGNVLDPETNLSLGARKLKGEADAFAAKYGRQPSAADLYLIHQQGAGGAASHMANPDAPAWQNMADTREGRQRGEGWAKRAIWGNVPDDAKAQYGSVENMTSRQFMDLWGRKVAGFGGQPANAAPMAPPAAATPQPPDGMDARTYNAAEAPNLTAQGPPASHPSLSNVVAERQPAASPGGLAGLFGGDPLRQIQGAVGSLFGVPQNSETAPSATQAQPQEDWQRALARLSGEADEQKRAEDERKAAEDAMTLSPMGVPQAPRRQDFRQIITAARQPIRLGITRG